MIVMALAMLTFPRRPRRVPLLPRPLLPHPPLPTYFYRLLPAARINSPDRDHRHPRRPSSRHLLGPSCQRHREHTGRRGWHAKLDRRTSASSLNHIRTDHGPSHSISSISPFSSPRAISPSTLASPSHPSSGPQTRPQTSTASRSSCSQAYGRARESHSSHALSLLHRPASARSHAPCAALRSSTLRS